LIKVLVVDDETVLVKGIKFNLENEGYQVSVAYDGSEALEIFAQDKFDLVILDLMLPKVDGLDVCRVIRESSKVPIIMLTAKSEDTDKLIGFEYGADDYLTKPFNILELKARIRAIIRRVSEGDEVVVELGGIVLDSSRKTVEVDGSPVWLTLKEFDLLELLMRNNGKVYNRETLLNTVWGYEYPGDIRTVDVTSAICARRSRRTPRSPRTS
jgi:DNA-binding response OmpR family regulator